MASLNLDETGERKFEHAMNGYGAVITGGTAADREEAIRNAIADPFIAVDCRDIASKEEFIETVLLDATDLSESDLEQRRSLHINMRRVLNADELSLVLLEFDAMESEVMTSIAQTMKGVAERAWDGMEIGYTCEEGDSVVRAEPDLSMRVRSWELD